MAIIKFINNKVSLKKTLNYICKEEKTDKKLISGKDCIPEIAYEEMMTVKKLYNKLTGREKIHFVQSFSPTDKLTYEQIINLKHAIQRDKEASEFVLDFMKEFEGSKNAFNIMKNKDNGANI